MFSPLLFSIDYQGGKTHTSSCVECYFSEKHRIPTKKLNSQVNVKPKAFYVFAETFDSSLFQIGQLDPEQLINFTQEFIYLSIVSRFGGTSVRLSFTQGEKISSDTIKDKIKEHFLSQKKLLEENEKCFTEDDPYYKEMLEQKNQHK